MKIISELFQKPLATVAIGFVIGLIIGLPILGWGLWPVEYYDAAPQNLRYDVKADYLRMAIDSYAVNKNEELAKDRYNNLGDDGLEILQQLASDPFVSTDNYSSFSNIVLGIGSEEGTLIPPGSETPATPTPKDSETTPTGLMKMLPIALGISCVFMLIIGAVLAYLLLVKNRKTPPRASLQQSFKHSVTNETMKYEEQEDDVDVPIARFMTTYTLGDDLYDDSFSIDAASGEFLGECGVGISHVIGTDEPKKVVAFEVWLFDKNDVQTVTKVLMSQFAQSDPDIHQTLAAKGEPIAIDSGKVIHIETATLQLEARVVDMSYGQPAAAMPPESFFDRITLELAVAQKES